MGDDIPKASHETQGDGGRAAMTPATRQRLQRVFEHGQRAFEKGDFAYAHDLFSQCVTEDRGNTVYLQHFRANLAKKHGDVRRSSGLASLRSKGGRSQIAKAIAKSEWQAAFTTACQILKKSPGDTSVLLELADACHRLGYSECRLFYLHWAREVDPKDVEINRRSAQALSDIGQFDQAIACWRRIEQLKPGDEEAHNAISRLSVEQTIHKGGYDPSMLGGGETDPEKAVRVADLSLRRSTDTALPVQRSASDVEGDDQRLLAAIDADPAATENYVALAESYTEAGRLRDAERLLSKALAVSGGGDLAIRTRLEDVHLMRVRNQVEVAQRRAAAGTPDALDLAKRMQQQANQAEAEVFAARAERTPGDPRLQFEFGLRLRRIGKYKEAIQAFQAARSDARRAAETQLHLGECFQHIEQFRLAMASYEAAIRASDHATEELRKLSLYRAGVLATGLKEFDAAERYLTDLAALDFGYRDVADRLDKIARIRHDA